MKIDARQRWIALVALLMAALTAAAWVREADRKSGTEIVEPPARPRQAQAARGADPATPDRVHLEKLRGRDVDSNANDAFATRSWRIPAPKAAATAPVSAVALPATPSPPTAPPGAPPLPFTYMGRLLSEETNAVFLTQGERNLVVHEGEIIESTYRVDKVSETRLTFTHLPSGVEQHLSIGEAK
ncbi:MAG: hypothetical protein ACREVT_14725 [Burkholderiales bacterium]